MTQENQEKEKEQPEQGESSDEDRPVEQTAEDALEDSSEKDESGPEAVEQAGAEKETESAAGETESGESEEPEGEAAPTSEPEETPISSEMPRDTEEGKPKEEVPVDEAGGEAEETAEETPAEELPAGEVAGESETARIAREAAESAPPEEEVPETEEQLAEALPSEQEEMAGEKQEPEQEDGLPAEAEPARAEAPVRTVEEKEEPVEKKARVSRSRGGLTMLPEKEQAEKRWYVIHAHSGHENKVKQSLENRVKQEGLDELVHQVLIPSEEVAEVKGGKKRITSRKIFPGYVLVEMKLTYDTWHLMRTTPGVTGFIGSGKMPTPLEPEEVESIFEQMRGEQKKPKPKVSFEKDEKVKIIEGPFTNFMGYVDEVNPERGKLKVMVEIFERLTSVELEFWQVEKI